MLKKIISGGQTGADRAGLDFARANGLELGGYCPKGRRAEDGPIAPEYPMIEMASADYAPRTRANVRAADATVLITMTPSLGSGSALTMHVARAEGKPLLQLHAGLSNAANRLSTFLESHDVRTLNVAGNRASEEPELYDFVHQVLQGAYQQLQAQPTKQVPSSRARSRRTA